MGVVIKTLPVTMTVNRLKELGKRLFNLGSKQLEFSYITKEVSIILKLNICLYIIILKIIHPIISSY